MNKIIHLNFGEKPDVLVLQPLVAVLEWRPEGVIEIDDVGKVGYWHSVPDKYFDRYVASAYQMINYIGYREIYIIGRPSV